MDEEDIVIDHLQNVISTLDTRARKMTGYADGRKMKKRTHWDELNIIVEKFLKGEAKRVVLIPGLRGTGKTTLLFQLYEHHKDRLEPGNIIFLECDRITEVINTTLSRVLKVYEEKFLGCDLESLDEKVIVMVDEAHYQQGWAPIIKSFSDRSRDILFIVTGSSSLSFETTSDLVRRSSMKKLFPLSFSEFILLKRHMSKGDEVRVSSDLTENLYRLCFGGVSSDEGKTLLHNCAVEYRKKYLPTVGNMRVEMEDYLLRGNFPFTILADEVDVYEDLFALSKRVIREDLPQFSNLSSRSIEKVISILRIVACSSREVSLQTISESVRDISPHTVSEIFKVLEKAGMIYILEPFGTTAKKVVSKSPRYHFSSPNIQATFRWLTGKLDKKSKNMGELLETAVADTLHRISATQKGIGGCWHDHKKNGADFIVDLNNGKRTVIETGWGAKNTGQILKSLERVDGDYGLVISDSSEKHVQRTVNGRTVDIYFVPKELFILL